MKPATNETNATWLRAGRFTASLVVGLAVAACGVTPEELPDGGTDPDGSVPDGGDSDGDAQGPDADGCAPSCDGVPCGAEDGCGGVCQRGSGCTCTPECEGRTCGVGDDGCGDICQPGSGCTPPPLAWTFRGAIAEGGQLDATRGPDGRIHLVSSRYYQIDASGDVVVDEPQGDGRQGAMDFPPAIAVGDDGTVHLVTRHGGDWTSGHEIRYRRRSAAGVWDLELTVGSPVGRNYVVAAAWAGAGQVHLLHSQQGDDVWGPLHLFRESGGHAPADGSLEGVWRADTHARARGRLGTVYFVSGKCDPDGRAYFSWASAGAGLAERLARNLREHRAGSGRRAFPDLYVDASGSVHLVYGAQHQIYYNRYSASGEPQLADDVLVFDGLGDWHLSTGLGAVAAADDGQTVLAVGLRSDGSAQASSSALLWSYSSDGGQTWSSPADSGRQSNAGEGRRLPRIVALGQTFFVFFQDNASVGVSLATVAAAPGP